MQDMSLDFFNSKIIIIGIRAEDANTGHFIHLHVGKGQGDAS